MPRIKSDGICYKCKNKILKSKSSILKHINDCYNLLSGHENECFLLLVESRAKKYWLVIKVNKETTLKKLDAFLRDVWVECCGHLSEFSENGHEIAFKYTAGDIFENYNKIDYVYDFGSSTHLSISIIGKIKNDISGDIKLLIRNEMPEFKCSECNKKAVFECSHCFETFCKSCGEEHDCIGDDPGITIAEIANSPRSGVCGYEKTDDKYFKKYLPETKTKRLS